MVISLRLNEEENELIKAFADINGISVSELFRRSVFERIEDEYDLRAFEKAKKEYLEDPTTYSHEDVIKMFEE